MKSLVASLVFFSALSAQAVSFDCYSFEEMGATYNISIGKARVTSDMNGRRFEARSVKVTDSGEVLLVAEGVGSATPAGLNLTLLEGGDMAVGSISAEEYAPGFLQGQMRIPGRHVVEIGCKVKK